MDQQHTVATERKEKDTFFRSEQSPIPADQREAFSGLEYFPYDPTFAVIATLHSEGAGTPVEIAATGGETRNMVTAGILSFSIGEEHAELTAYKQEGESERLFIPFLDPTNGRSTYSAGRYVDLERKGDESEVLLDFNRAYNPFCAYNADYSCPIVPATNRIAISIEAGERFSGHADQHGVEE